MTKHFRRSEFFKYVIGAAFVCFTVQHAWAETLLAFHTPPSQLDGLSQSELNEFGMSLADEAFGTHSRVEGASGQTGGTQNVTDPNDVEDVKAMFDDDAMIQLARLNYGLTKATYEPNDVDDFTITDMVISRASEEVLVASFNVALPNRVDLSSGIIFGGESLPRLVVLRWNNQANQWKIFTSADFDSPQSFLCNKDSSYKPQKSQFDDAAIALGRALIDELMDASLNGTEKSVQAEGFQYVFASGERKTSSGPIRTKMTSRVIPENVEAIRSGSLLAVRSDSTSTLTLDGGAVEKTLRPGLYTFQLEQDGRWRVVAIAIFKVTEKVKEGIVCVE
jgi:hypothetical protein